MFVPVCDRTVRGVHGPPTPSTAKGVPPRRAKSIVVDMLGVGLVEACGGDGCSGYYAGLIYGDGDTVGGAEWVKCCC